MTTNTTPVIIGSTVQVLPSFTHYNGFYVGKVGTVQTFQVAYGDAVEAFVRFAPEDVAHECGRHPFILAIPYDHLRVA